MALVRAGRSARVAPAEAVDTPAVPRRLDRRRRRDRAQPGVACADDVETRPRTLDGWCARPVARSSSRSPSAAATCSTVHRADIEQDVEHVRIVVQVRDDIGDDGDCTDDDGDRDDRRHPATRCAASVRSQDATPTTSTRCARLPLRDRERPRRSHAWSTTRREHVAAHHDEPARAPERDVDELVIELDERAARDRRGQRHLGVRPHRRGPGVLLRPRPQAGRRRPQHRGAAARADRAEVDALLLAPHPHDAPHAPADHLRGERRRVRRRHVPRAGGRDAGRGGLGRVQRHRHRERPHQHRAGRELAAAAPHRRVALERPAADGPARRHRRGLPPRPRVAGAPRRRADARGAEIAAACASSAPTASR